MDSKKTKSEARSGRSDEVSWCVNELFEVDATRDHG